MKRVGLGGPVANLLLAVSALVFTFIALELGVRLFVDVREFGPTAVEGVDPEQPIRFLPNSQFTYETREFRYTVSFNRFGRRDDEWSQEQIQDPENLLFVGDSFVLGNGLDHEATVPTRLEDWIAERGARREVFNFGMPAGHPRTYLMLLENALESGFRARTLIVGIFVGNDFYPEVLNEKPIALTPRQTPRRPSPWSRSELVHFLKLRLATSARAVGWALTLGPKLGIDVYDTSGSYIFLRTQTPEQSSMFQEILEFFGRMQELARREDRELRLIIFPNRIQVENREDLTNAIFDATRPNELIMDYCRERGIACLDLLPLLAERYEADREPLYFPIDRHMNEKGAQLSAEAIGGFLAEVGTLR